MIGRLVLVWRKTLSGAFCHLTISSMTMKIVFDKINMKKRSTIDKVKGVNMGVYQRNKRTSEAVELYKAGTASVGFCAQMAEVDIETFIKVLGEHGISIFEYESVDEIKMEVEHTFGR